MNGVSPQRRLLEMIQLERRDIYIIVLLTTGMGLLNLAIPVSVQALVNTVTMGGLIKPLIIISLMLFVFLFFAGALYVLEIFVVELIQRRVFVRSAVEAASKVQSAQIETHDRNNTVELMNRFFEVTAVQKSLAMLLTVAIASSLQATIGSIILIFYSAYFAIVVALILLMLFIILRIIGHNAVPSAIEESKTKFQVAAWLETVARNLNTFKFSGGRQLALQRLDHLSLEYLGARRQHFRILTMQNMGGVVLYALGGTAMLTLGGALVIRGQINLGQFVAAELIIFGVLASILRLIGQLEYYYDLMAGLDKLGVLSDIPQERYGTHALAADQPIKLTLHAVSFEYSPLSRPWSDLSLTVAPGAQLAIVGRSGSGKSTLADIITGLRPPTYGHVKYNHIDLRELDLRVVREHVSLVNKLEIIEDSVLENVRLQRPDIEIAEVIALLDQLGLMQDISKLDDGIATWLTSTGAPLSLVQTRMLVLARALMAKPALLVVDDLLDGLDDLALERALALLLGPDKPWTLIVMTRSEAIAARFGCVLHLDPAGGLHE